jgi:hypothetical protein
VLLNSLAVLERSDRAMRKLPYIGKEVPKLSC